MEILASRMLFRPADYERSLTFYRDELGLAIFRDYGAGTVFYAGQSLIELAAHGAPEHPAGEFPGALWLQVRDVRATQAELEGRGVPIAREARQESWGSTAISVFFFCFYFFFFFFCCCWLSRICAGRSRVASESR